VATNTSGADAATRLALLQRALVMGLRPPPDARADGYPARTGEQAAGPFIGEQAAGPFIGEQAAGPLAEDGPRRRQRLYGRLAAVFFAGSGALGLITLPLPAPGSNAAAMTVVCTVAVILGIAIWFAPWEEWPRRASLAVLPAAFALIALSNTFGGADLYNYSLFFAVAFVWIGMSQPPRTSAAMAPLAAAAYILPLFAMPGHFWAGLSSAAMTIPICVLVGEGIAWGAGRHDQIERQLRRERDLAGQLRELDEMKDAFLSAVSHELRTPITICRGHLEVLEDGAGELEVRAVKETLVDELALMGRLVEDLATLARVDDRALLRLESVPVGCFLRGTAAKAEPILGDRLRVAECGTEGAMLRADPQRLSQALLNLVRNAAEHAAGDGPVRLRATAEPASWLFEVADSGGGVPPGEEQALFEPFTTGSSGSGGTGLGLAIVRGIARAHGGEAGVVNRPGAGATFWMRIPR
jgi:signal transduction histidine kinase